MRIDCGFRGFVITSLILAGRLAVLGLEARAEEPEPTRSETLAGRRFHELTKFKASEAHQGVAVDDKQFYAIANRTIGKYEKATGNFLARWDAPEDSSLKHLNSGVVIDGKLYCAHSNWPNEPVENSIEVWDAATLTPLERRQFEEPRAAITWIDRHAGAWWIVFASYGTKPQVRKTKLVRVDDAWNRVASWTFPEKVIERFVPFSCSGGSWGPDGLLYVTGHDHAETYALRVPKNGTLLELAETIAAPITGQGIAWDRTGPAILYGIRRSENVVVAARVPP